MSRYVRFGRVFKQGQVRPSYGLQVVNRDTGALYPTQQDIRATWPDGSVMHAVFHADLGSATANINYKLTANGYSPSGSAPTVTQAISAGVQAILTVVDGGTTYTANLQTMLQGAANVQTLQSGPLLTEWRLYDSLRTAANAAHPVLLCQMQVAFFANNEARIIVQLENTKTFASGRGPRTCNITFSVGGTQLYSNSSLVVPAACVVVMPEGYYGAAKTWYAHGDITYMMMTKVVPYVWSTINPTAASLNALTTSWSPMGRGGTYSPWDDTADHQHIGPVPMDSGLFLGSKGDKRAYNSLILNGYAIGGYSVYWRDEATGQAPSLVTHPTMVWNDPAAQGYFGIGNDPNAGNGNSQNLFSARDDDVASHCPSYSFLPYLLTGDYCHLDMMQMLSTFCLTWLNASNAPNGHSGALGIMGGLQNRSVGWGLLSIARTAALTPDAHSMKSYWKTIVGNNATFYNNRYNSNGQNSLGFLTGLYDGDVSPDGPQSNLGFKAWQNDYTVWSVAQAVNLGFTAFAPFRDWMFKSVLGRYGLLPGDTGYCYISSANYALFCRASASQPFDTTYTQVYARNFSNLQQYTCGSSQMGSAIGGLQAGQIAGNNQSVGYYPQYDAMALSEAVDAGYPNALAAWNLYWNSINRLTVANASTDPRWCLQPRTVTLT